MLNALHDLRYTLRQLRKSPGFAITAILTLALGIGANTAIFTLVKGILLRTLSVSDPSQLYRIGDTDNCCVNGGFVEDNGDFDIFSFDLYQYFRQGTPEFEQLAAVQAGQPQFSVRRGNELAHELHGEFVSGNLFSTLGLMPYLGRLMSDADDQPNSPPVVVLSYQGWQSDFGRDPTLIGSTISIEAHPFTVIGIGPPGYFGDRVTDSPPDFWIPLSTEPLVHGEDQAILHHPDSHWLYPIGRVRPGTNVAALQSKLSVLLRQWLSHRTVYTANGGAALIPRQHVRVVSAGGGIQNLQYEAGTGLKMLMILSTVVLLIACANIANLMLARGTSRRADTAVRMAMGASRTRVMQHAITECVLLSCIGGLAGLVVAYMGSRTILALAFPDAHHLPISATPSFAILGFAFAISLITGVLFGLAPAWLASHAQPAEALRGVNRSLRDRSSLPQKLLVVFQAALSIVLIAGAILMTKSLGQSGEAGLRAGHKQSLRAAYRSGGCRVHRGSPACALSLHRGSLFNAAGRCPRCSSDVQPAGGRQLGRMRDPAGPSGAGAERPLWVDMGARNAPVSRVDWGTDCARPRPERPGHGDQRAGCVGQSDVRQTVLPQGGSHWPAFWHRRSQILRILQDCWRLP